MNLKKQFILVFVQRWLFVGISHPTKKIPITGIKKPAISRRWKIPKKSRIPWIKIPRLGKNPETKKSPEPRGFAKNPDGQTTVKTQKIFLIFFKGISNFRWKFKKFKTKFLGFFDLAQNLNSGSRKNSIPKPTV